MKVAVLNFTGTVGKTTLAVNLLAPRMPGAQIIAIETINETAATNGLDVEKMRGDRFQALFKKLITSDNAIVDVGASNIEGFLKGLTAFADSQVEIDYFLVPVTSGTKEQMETISLIKTLSKLAVASERIRIVFNRVENSVVDEFAAILGFARQERCCVADARAAVFENELFDMMTRKKTSIEALVSDNTDYKSKIRGLRGEEHAAELSQYTDLHVMKSLAKGVTSNLDRVFAVLFDKEQVA